MTATGNAMRAIRLMTAAVEMLDGDEYDLIQVGVDFVRHLQQPEHDNCGPFIDGIRKQLGIPPK